MRRGGGGLGEGVAHGGVAALQEGLGVPEQQAMVGVHHVGLPLGQRLVLLVLVLVLVLVCVRAVEGALPPLLQQALLERREGD